MCATCGGPLLSRQAKVYCSRPCANGRAGTRAGSRTARPCEICGQQFKAKGSGRTAGYVQRTCGRACGVELRRRKGNLGASGAAQRKHWPASRVYIRSCEHCGELFVGRRENSRYCSLRCTQTAGNYRRRGAPQCRCACGAQIPAKRNKCDDCLAADKKLRRQRKKRAERARKRGARRELYTLAEIAARDRYRCGICIAEGRSHDQSRPAPQRTDHRPRRTTGRRWRRHAGERPARALRMQRSQAHRRNAAARADRLTCNDYPRGGVVTGRNHTMAAAAILDLHTAVIFPGADHEPGPARADAEGAAPPRPHREDRRRRRPGAAVDGVRA